ncbi:MAG: hypothetical protein H2044_01390 [Rhizobiales bacterium]|nr:hypothetical protein [Hyphomicrobiales bacterium]
MPYAFEGGVCSDPVEGAIEITAEQYAAALDGMMSGKAVSVLSGFSLIDAPVVEEPNPEDDLALFQWKIMLSAKIDEEAERARLRYITGGSGQAMTYQQKAQEAAEVLALVGSGEIDASHFPLLSAEVGITAATLVEVAQVVDYAYQTWRVVGAQIEALRLGGKASVSSASTIPAAKAAAQIQWP